MKINPNLERIARHNCWNAKSNEWISKLYYKTYGSLDSIKDLKFEGMSACVMQEGDSTFTITKNDNKFIDWMNHYGIIQKYMTDGWAEGLLHSHNNMFVNPSAEDDDELFRSSALHKYYLSVIVNNFGFWSARFCFRDTITHQTGVPDKYPGMHPGYEGGEYVEDVLFIYEVDVLGQEPPEQIWIDQFAYARKVGKEKDRKGNLKQPIYTKQPFGNVEEDWDDDEWAAKLDSNIFKNKIPKLDMQPIRKGEKVSSKTEPTVLIEESMFDEDLSLAVEYWLFQTNTGKYVIIEDMFHTFFENYKEGDIVNLATLDKMLNKTLRHIYKLKEIKQVDVEVFFELVYNEIRDVEDDWMLEIEKYKNNYIYNNDRK